MSFWIYLSVAAWQDGRHQAVSGRVFLFFFAHFLTSQVCQCVCGADLQEMPAFFYGIAEFYGNRNWVSFWAAPF